ncbi:MAG: DUF2723 domain-containing protein [Deltaproteobacteria bacterium]|nr:DUF2723 domain-containing protein [Deltaproteobacteria bacterium]
MTHARAVGVVAAAGVLVFIVYLVGLNPSVGWFDGGELVVAAHRLGSSHPPGQPAHALLTKAFLFLPFGDIGFRANLVSAAAGALSAFLVGLLVLWVSLRLMSSPRVEPTPSQPQSSPRPLGFLVPLAASATASEEDFNAKAQRSRDAGNETSSLGASAPLRQIPATASAPVIAGAVAAAVAFALSPFAVEQAVRAEVYALELAICLAIATFLVAPALPLAKRLAAAAFLVGLGAGVHPPLTAVWALVLFAAAFAHFGRDLLRPNRVAPLLVALLFGCAVLVYLPLAVRDGGFSWGRPNTAGHFFDVLTVRAYAAKLSLGGADPGEPLAIIGALVVAGASLALVIAGAVSAIALSVHRSRIGFAVIGAFLASLTPLFANRVIWPENPDSRGYLLVPLSLVFIVAMVAPAVYLARRRWAPLRALAMLLPVGLGASIVARFDLPTPDHTPGRYAREIVERLPERSLALLSSDHAVFLALYSQEVENRRPDVVFGASGLLDSSWVVDRIRRATPRVLTPFVDFVALREQLGDAWLQKNADRRPIAVEEPPSARAALEGPLTCDGLVCLAGQTSDPRGAIGLGLVFAEAERSRDPSTLAFVRRLRIVRALDAARRGDSARAIAWVMPEFGDAALAATISIAGAAWPFSFPVAGSVPPRRTGNDFVSSPAEPYRIAGNLLAGLGIPAGDQALLRAVQLGSVDACIDLAGLSARRSKVNRAGQIVAECVAANERHAATLRQNAGVAFANAGHLALAEREFREALRLMEAGQGVNELAPADRPKHLASVLSALARVRFDRGDRREAEDLRERALKIMNASRR